MAFTMVMRNQFLLIRLLNVFKKDFNTLISTELDVLIANKQTKSEWNHLLKLFQISPFKRILNVTLLLRHSQLSQIVLRSCQTVPVFLDKTKRGKMFEYTQECNGIIQNAKKTQPKLQTPKSETVHQLLVLFKWLYN